MSGLFKFAADDDLSMLDVSKWDVHNVTTFRYMFYGCKNIKNLDLSKWDVRNGINFEFMFAGCSDFNSDLSGWNVSNAKNLSAMFYECESINFDLSNWNVNNCTNFDNMFKYANYDGIKFDWTITNVDTYNNLMESKFFRTYFDRANPANTINVKFKKD